MATDGTPSAGLNRTELGLDANVEGVLAYLLGMLSGVALYLVEDNDFVRFHAAQSIVASAVATAALVGVGLLASVVGMLASGSPGGGAIALLFGLIDFGLAMVVIAGWLFLMLRASQGQRYRIPVLGGLAEALV
jgi:uncharacterized membrane protein